ncbi:hypothetical protein N9O97_01555 [Flavobacteriaceae bacterium]|nr:hypothetical protein [Flavobacteriaceae bacterium]
MKKLPDFRLRDDFKSLFKQMNVEYSDQLKDVNWEELTIEKQILLKGEADKITSDDLVKFLDIDGVFRVNGKPVLLYIRDQSRNIKNIHLYNNENFESSYRYHLMCCRTVYGIIVKEKRDRYVYKDYLFEENPKFKVNITEGKKYKTLDNVKLQVCQNCIKETNIINWNSMSWPSKKEYLDTFSPKEFCKYHKNNYLKSMVGSSYMRTEIDLYPKNWKSISDKYKFSKNYKCESCNIDLSNHKKYLHVHHMRRRDQNDDNFLQALCIECHGLIGRSSHSFIQHSPQHIFFKNKIKPKVINQ